MTDTIARFGIVDTKRKTEYGYEKIVVSQARGFSRRSKTVLVERWNGPQNGSFWVSLQYRDGGTFVMDSRAVIELGKWLEILQLKGFPRKNGDKRSRR